MEGSEGEGIGRSRTRWKVGLGYREGEGRKGEVIEKDIHGGEPCGWRRREGENTKK